MIQPSDTAELVSVVICAYNNWPDLELTIESALNQSYRPVEVIVVDNSSVDRTLEEIPKRFSNRVRYARQATNTGNYGAYNAGLAMARGEFIQFINGDDLLTPNKIAKQMEIFRAEPLLDIVYGDVRKFGALAGIADWEDAATQPEEDMLKTVIALDGLGLNTIGMLFHRRVFDKVGVFDASLWVGDYDYWLRAALAGCRFGHCSGSPMGFYRQHTGQMSKDFSTLMRGVETAWRKALGYAREPYRSMIAYRLVDSVFHRSVCRIGKLTRQQALAELALARATCPEYLSAPVYAIGRAAIVLPGGATLFRSPRLRAMRQFFGRWLIRRPEDH